MVKGLSHWSGAVALMAACTTLYFGADASAANVQVTVVDAQGRPLQDAVVFLDSPELARSVKPLAGAAMGQRNKMFEPATLVVTRGTAVDFPNRDTVRHHVYSFSPAKKFELKLYTGTPATPVVFDQAGIVVLGCNIHDHMVGWVVVVETPYFALADAMGNTQIKEVPAGNYQMRVWHNSLAVGAPAQVQALRVGADPVSASVTLKH